MARTQQEITHCPRGHEYTEENTGWKKSYRAQGASHTRLCRACDRDRHSGQLKGRERTHCNLGHELTENNTYWVGSPKRRSCRTCNLAGTVKRAKLGPNRFRQYALKGTYNLTIEQFDNLYDKQNGKCAITGCTTELAEDDVLRIDHDHSCCAGRTSCGKCVRGLLCRHCNSALGFAKDDPKLLRAMIDYLEGYNDRIQS